MSANITLSAIFLPSRCGFQRNRILYFNVTVYCKLCASVEKKVPCIVVETLLLPHFWERGVIGTLVPLMYHDVYTVTHHLLERLPSGSHGKRLVIPVQYLALPQSHAEQACFLIKSC